MWRLIGCSCYEREKETTIRKNVNNGKLKLDHATGILRQWIRYIPKTGSVRVLYHEGQAFWKSSCHKSPAVTLECEWLCLFGLSLSVCSMLGVFCLCVGVCLPLSLPWQSVWGRAWPGFSTHPALIQSPQLNLTCSSKADLKGQPDVQSPPDRYEVLSTFKPLPV